MSCSYFETQDHTLSRFFTPNLCICAKECTPPSPTSPEPFPRHFFCQQACAPSHVWHSQGTFLPVTLPPLHVTLLQALSPEWACHFLIITTTLVPNFFSAFLFPIKPHPIRNPRPHCSAVAREENDSIQGWGESYQPAWWAWPEILWGWDESCGDPRADGVGR